MAEIAVLPREVADQIAAGEVVERPASVLKELVENAIDAGAGRIACEIEEGGRRAVAVRDDGRGMTAEDARLSLLRHATSKIRAIGDLSSLRTLGFRGEALPSIASVSRLEIVTRVREEPAGTRLLVEGGRVLREEPVGAPPGTFVRAADLFFNTPARRAGLRSAAAEAQASVRTLVPLALAYPQVALSLVHDGRAVFRTPGSGRLRDALAALYGPDLAARCLPLSYDAPGLRISGAAGLPELARGDRRLQTIVVNGHAVSAPGLRAAAESAFRGLLPRDRRPVFVLVLEVDPAAVDVNVHPRKSEVRFRDERVVAQAVAAALRAALASHDLTPAYGLGPRPRPAPSGDGAAVAEALALYAADAPPARPARSPQGEAADGRERPARLPPLRVVGCLDDAYLVALGPDGAYFVDQHAAHEKVQYERILARDGRAVAAQSLALPIVVELDPGAVLALADWWPLLAELGLSAEPFGGASVVVRSVPAAFARDPERAVRDFFARLLDEERASLALGRPEEVRAQAFARAACRSAVRAGERLAPDERQALVDELRLLAEPHTCPHGRPTVWRIPTEELARRFGRR
ncbi:MAG: DNA mismatch repair endonuclease MutL [Clostridia bacterium]|nr:DNA mismatch repair endonuclease MutL [Clostridia bacterium]